ncbi:MAG TPA: hypothetical protein VIX14_02560 [Terriglobales bacterium]
MARKRKQDSQGKAAVLPVMRADGAGIDIGATEIFVAVPPDRATEARSAGGRFCGQARARRTAVPPCRHCPAHGGSVAAPQQIRPRDFYRRMRAKLGAPKATTAAAPKLARIIFPLVTPHQEFDARHFAPDQIRFHKRQEAKFRAQARALGFPTYSLGTDRMSEFLKSGKHARFAKARAQRAPKKLVNEPQNPCAIDARLQAAIASA